MDVRLTAGFGGGQGGGSADGERDIRLCVCVCVTCCTCRIGVTPFLALFSLAGDREGGEGVPVNEDPPPQPVQTYLLLSAHGLLRE